MSAAILVNSEAAPEEKCSNFVIYSDQRAYFTWRSVWSAVIKARIAKWSLPKRLFNLTQIRRQQHVAL